MSLYLNKDKNHKIKIPENSGRGLKLAINNFIQFLSLLSISALFIASVGLANSLLSYLNDKYVSIAIKKAIGMKNSKIKSDQRKKSIRIKSTQTKEHQSKRTQEII